MASGDTQQQGSLKYAEFAIQSVLEGVPACAHHECVGLHNSIWVDVDGVGECLRYYSSGLTEVTPSAVFYLHGDRIWSGKAVSYDDNNTEAQQKYAEDAARSIGMPFVRIARPGLYGSSGAHSARRQMREMKLVAGAVAGIIKRHRLERFGFSGQSGGGSVAAYLLTQFPHAECVAFTSSCLSLQGLKKAGQISGGYDYGADGIYDPLLHLSEVPVDRRRGLFVIGDEKDQFALFPNQVEFYEAAKAAGHDVTLIRSEGESHHGLDSTGQHAVAWFLQGCTVREIEQRIADRAVIY